MPSDGSFAGLLRSGDQPQERRLTAAVAAEDRPTIAVSDGEGYSVEDPRGAELYPDIR
jgi:hypothetical protein